MIEQIGAGRVARPIDFAPDALGFQQLPEMPLPIGHMERVGRCCPAAAPRVLGRRLLHPLELHIGLKLGVRPTLFRGKPC
ncbi:hypothetical protein [Bosea sp. (in: a-proteobacteria)]|uniref:hypothetical protein n=1 Tax=Bosea sp. (in: a-proteobacteria) TaxID=1871050 RepID=UPI002FC75F0A